MSTRGRFSGRAGHWLSRGNSEGFYISWLSRDLPPSRASGSNEDEVVARERQMAEGIHEGRSVVEVMADLGY